MTQADHQQPLDLSTCVAAAARPKGAKTPFSSSPSPMADREEPNDKSQKKGSRNPKPPKRGKSRDSHGRNDRGMVANGAGAPGAAPRRGEGTATKRSGREAPRKTQRAGRATPHQSEAGKKNKTTPFKRRRRSQPPTTPRPHDLRSQQPAPPPTALERGNGGRKAGGRRDDNLR